MTSKRRVSVSDVFSILTIAAGLAIFALLTFANAASALDANSANPSEVAIPLAKCTGTQACDGINPNLVADGACNGDYACYRYVSGLLTVASNSCNGEFACEETHGTVGAGSCNAAYACLRAGGSIGAGSCNASSACEETQSTVGNYSCNGFVACYFAATSIGDCQLNTTAPPACVASTATPTDTPTGTPTDTPTGTPTSTPTATPTSALNPRASLPLMLR